MTAYILNFWKATILGILRSEEVCSLIDELVRVQFRDIAMLRGYALQKDPDNPDWKPNLKAFAAAIAARGFMVSCLKPKKIEQKIESGESFRVEIIDNSKTLKLLMHPSQLEISLVGTFAINI